MKKAFTLIELLVVIAIIGLLSSIVLVSLNGARARARDARRQSEIKQMAMALKLYAEDNNGNFPSNIGCLNGWCCLGHGDSGTCWAGQYHGSTALDNSLKPKYMAVIPDDPLNNTSRYGDAYMYRIDSDYATLHWAIEGSNPNSESCLGGTLGNWGAGNGIGSNYYCMYIVKY